MANPEQAGEPSMEEILASIRKIISDEEDTPEEGMDPPAETDLADEDGQDKAFEAAEIDVFEAIEEAPAAEEEDPFANVLDDAVEADVFETVEDDGVLALSEGSIVDDSQIDESMLVLGPAPEDDDIAFTEAEAPAEPEPQPESVVEPESKPSHPPAEVPASAGLLSGEANAAVSTAFGNLANVMLSGSARTLEDLVKEMLQPMLKGWLDQNLPPLVERLVRDEIERVSRGGGG